MNKNLTADINKQPTYTSSSERIVPRNFNQNPQMPSDNAILKTPNRSNHKKLSSPDKPFHPTNLQQTPNRQQQNIIMPPNNPNIMSSPQNNAFIIQQPPNQQFPNQNIIIPNQNIITLPPNNQFIPANANQIYIINQPMPVNPNQQQGQRNSVMSCNDQHLLPNQKPQSRMSVLSNTNINESIEEEGDKKKPMIIDEGKQRYTGRLKFFDEVKNYGFIIMDNDGGDIFVHYDD